MLFQKKLREVNTYVNIMTLCNELIKNHCNLSVYTFALFSSAKVHKLRLTWYVGFLCYRKIFEPRFRNCAWHRHFCNYFPIKLVKTTDLDPNKLYLFCTFPHGILSLGVYGAFATDIISCRELFPGVEFRIAVLAQHFKTPLYREYSRITCTYYLLLFIWPRSACTFTPLFICIETFCFINSIWISP